MGKNKYKTTATREMKDQARAYFKYNYQHNKTRSRYVANYFDFITFCREKFNCKTKNECENYVQNYEEFLEGKGYTPSTIHNKLAPICIYHCIKMSEIQKPKRATSNYTRGRSFNDKKEMSTTNMDNPLYKRSIEFQKRVGIRRNELLHLQGDDFIVDESGYPCVRIKHGKGNKMQLQRLLPEDVDFVGDYFMNIAPNESVFPKKEIASNNINYHFLRACQAQKAYEYYLNEIEKGGDEYRQQLISELQNRAKLYRINKKTGKHIPIPEKEIKGTYWLRGNNKKFALEHGLPVRYDKLAVMATSVFHLSHWRCDVTIASYLLAI